MLGLRWEGADLSSTPARVTIAGAETFDSESGHHRQDARKGRMQRGDTGLVLAVPAWATALLLAQRVASGASEFVLPSRTGTLRSQNNFRTSLRAAVAGTEFDGWLTPHVLRATVATVVDAALGLDAASAQLDHAGTAVTSRHYLAKPSMAPDATSALEGLGPVEHSTVGRTLD